MCEVFFFVFIAYPQYAFIILYLGSLEFNVLFAILQKPFLVHHHQTKTKLLVSAGRSSLSPFISVPVHR